MEINRKSTNIKRQINKITKLYQNLRKSTKIYKNEVEFNEHQSKFDLNECKQILGSNPSNFKGANLPVEEVSWDAAVSVCAKLTERERRAGRAGTAGEGPDRWSAAADGGAQTERVGAARLNSE